MNEAVVSKDTAAFFFRDGCMESLRGVIKAEIVKQIWRQDDLRWVLIVKEGGRFTFLEDASCEGVTYDNWPSLLEGGWYATAALAEQDARKIVPWMDKDSK